MIDIPANRVVTAAIIVCGLLGWVPLEQSVGQQVGTNANSNDLNSEYLKVYEEHRTELMEFAKKCESLEKPGLASFTRSWVPERDPSREYFFVLPSNRSLMFPKTTDRVGLHWKEHLDKKNASYAARLFELAEKANKVKEYELAYRLLHECVFHNPQYEGANNVLGIDRAAPKTKAYALRRKEDFFPDGELVKFESDHFQLITSLDERTAKDSLAKFERWHVVWRQMFFGYWAQSGWLNRRFESGAKPTRRTKKFKVVLYKDRNEYLAKLRPTNPGIDVSVGYYLFREKTSFFYAGDDTDETTWVHEITHQFMHETIPVSSRSEIRNSIWAVEGIAMFMESLTDFKTHVTLGGQDAERLNFCRYNFFRRGFFVEMGQLNAMTPNDFVKSKSVKGLYSLSAAYCHYLLSLSDEKKDKSIKKAFLKFLQLVHQGKNTKVYFDRIAAQVSFDKGFKDFLKPKKELLSRSLIRPENCRILYLGNSDIGDEVLEKIKNATELETLDLSGTRVTDVGIQKLSGMTKLEFLSLEKTKITNNSMKVIGKLSSLEELDLTTTAVTDMGMKEVRGLSKLVALWIAGTRVSDGSVDLILSLPSLKQLDIRKTEVSAAGRKKLNAKFNLVD